MFDAATYFPEPILLNCVSKIIDREQTIKWLCLGRSILRDLRTSDNSFSHHTSIWRVCLRPFSRGECPKVHQIVSGVLFLFVFTLPPARTRDPVLARKWSKRPLKVCGPYQFVEWNDMRTTQHAACDFVPQMVECDC